MKSEVRDIYKGAVMEIHSPAVLPRVSFPPEFFADIQNDYQGTSPYHLSYCGYQKCPPGHRAGPFVRTSFLMHVVLNGTGVYKVHGKTYDVVGGQVFLIRPGVTTTYIADMENPWEYGWVGCSGYRIPQLLEQIGFSEENPVITVQNAQDLMEIILRMMEVPRMTLPEELYRTAELLRFFGTMIEGRKKEHSMSHIYSGETYAQVALRYLNDNYMYQIRISDLAAAIGVERSYLSRVFYNEYHQSPQQYLVRLRMEKACEMLGNTHMSIAEIAAAVGYEDPRSFTKMFRQRQGISPSEYRTASGGGPASG